MVANRTIYVELILNILALAQTVQEVQILVRRGLERLSLVDIGPNFTTKKIVIDNGSSIDFPLLQHFHKDRLHERESLYLKGTQIWIDQHCSTDSRRICLEDLYHNEKG